MTVKVWVPNRAIDAPRVHEKGWSFDIDDHGNLTVLGVGGGKLAAYAPGRWDVVEEVRNES